MLWVKREFLNSDFMKRRVLLYDRLSKGLIAVAKELSEEFSITPDGWYPVSLLSSQIVDDSDLIILAAHDWERDIIPHKFVKGISQLSKMNLFEKDIALLSYDRRKFIETPPKSIQRMLENTGVRYLCCISEPSISG